MKWPVIILISCFLLPVGSIAQNTFAFKGQIFHNQQGPQKRIRVIVNNQYPAITDDAGVFQVALVRGTTHIRVALTQPDYQILYPSNGYVAIPRDLKDVPQIIIGSAKDNIYLQQYLKLYQLKRKETSTSAAHMKEITRKMDSLQKMLLRLHYTEADLRKAEKIQEGKDDYLPEISADIIDYRNQTFSLISAFKYVSEYAFENASALQALLEAVNKYNDSYHKLDRQQLNYERRLSEFWENDSLTVAYHDLADFSLNKLHAERIYPLQEVILQIRQYFTGKKKNKKLKQDIQQNISKYVSQLDVIYPELEKRTNVVIQLLRE
jgi:hypothetical protein